MVQAIPIVPERLKLNEKVQNGDTNNQVLISATIMPPSAYDGNERNTDSILKDLDELIKQKKYNLISNSNITKFLDEYYGAQTLRKLYLLLYLTLFAVIYYYYIYLIADFWTRYEYQLIILALAILVVSCALFYANYRYSEVIMNLDLFMIFYI